MKLRIPALSLGLALAAAPYAALSAAPPAPAEGAAPADHATLERQLDDAHRRLENAAKEVAELSMQLTPDLQSLHLQLDAHHHPVIGAQLGEARPGGGVAISGVSPGGAAAEAGLAAGDVIVSINGQKVASAKEVAEDLHKVPPGTPAQIERSRGGKIATVAVTPRAVDPRISFLLDDHLLGMQDFEHGMHDLMEHAMPGMGGWGELELCEVSPELGRYFGTDKGVLVVHTSPAFADKLKDGDVILAIGDREAKSASQALRILRSYEPGDKVALSLERDRKALKLDVTMPQRSEHHPRAPHVPAPPGAPPAPPAPPSASSSSTAGDSAETL